VQAPGPAHRESTLQIAYAAIDRNGVGWHYTSPVAGEPESKIKNLINAAQPLIEALGFSLLRVFAVDDGCM
jgi:hypothetical protein